MDNPKNIIFLDVDGPINTDKNKLYQKRKGRSISSYHIILPREQILNLRDIARQFSNTEIVLSSKWRLGGYPSRARINLERQISPYGLKIFSETPYLNNARGEEINMWLYNFKQRNGYIPPYVVLDDNVNIVVDHHKGHIVYCNPNFGITRREVNIAINILKKYRYNLYESRGKYNGI